MSHAATADVEGFITEMPLPQENFETAVRSANDTIKTLYGIHPSQINLAREGTQRLQRMLWDLEAIAAALRLELMNRETHQPIDLG